jgi:hypothetical protein
MHEMGHNVSLNSPAGYYSGRWIGGNANAIYSESMAQIFAHATAYHLLNRYQGYGISDSLAADIEYSVLSSMRTVRRFYEEYLSTGRPFASWNDPSTPVDETISTFMTIAYKFFEHVELDSSGCIIPLKRMMALLQTFNEDMKVSYNPQNNTTEAETFRSTLMVAALSYAFQMDLREEFRELNFPIDDAVYNELYYSPEILNVTN